MRGEAFAAKTIDVFELRMSSASNSLLYSASKVRRCKEKLCHRVGDILVRMRERDVVNE